MDNLHSHYGTLLGLGDSWLVEEVDLDLSGSQVVIRLQHAVGVS